MKGDKPSATEAEKGRDSKVDKNTKVTMGNAKEGQDSKADQEAIVTTTEEVPDFKGDQPF